MPSHRESPMLLLWGASLCWIGAWGAVFCAAWSVQLVAEGYPGQQQVVLQSAEDPQITLQGAQAIKSFDTLVFRIFLYPRLALLGLSLIVSGVGGILYRLSQAS